MLKSQGSNPKDGRGNPIKALARVELHPGTDFWMRGARFATVTRIKNETTVYIRLDKLPMREYKIASENVNVMVQS